MATAVRFHLNSLHEQTHPASTHNPAKSSANGVVYRCGDAVPAPGTYWVSHYNHRERHAAKVRFTVFPACAQCGHKVQFTSVTPEKGMVAEWLRRDPDFKHALKPLRRRRGVPRNSQPR